MTLGSSLTDLIEVTNEEDSGAAPSPTSERRGFSGIAYDL